MNRGAILKQIELLRAINERILDRRPIRCGHLRSICATPRMVSTFNFHGFAQMRVGVVIQARTGSKRFPAKVLANLAGKSVIQHVVERCREFGERTIIIAPHYDVGVFTDLGVRVFYGPEDDVLTRYFKAAKAYRFDPIVRITADCPLIRPPCG